MEGIGANTKSVVNSVDDFFTYSDKQVKNGKFHLEKCLLFLINMILAIMILIAQ